MTLAQPPVEAPAESGLASVPSASDLEGDR